MRLRPRMLRGPVLSLQTKCRVLPVKLMRLERTAQKATRYYSIRKSLMLRSSVSRISSRTTFMKRATCSRSDDMGTQWRRVGRICKIMILEPILKDVSSADGCKFSEVTNMRCSFLFVLFLLAARACVCQDLSVSAVHRCGARIIAEVRFLNTSKTQTIETPLSPDYDYGHALGSAVLQYRASPQKWANVQRGTDLHPAGLRYLEPGEAIDDVIVADMPASLASKAAGLHLRVSLAFASKGSRKYRFLYSQPFLADEKSSPDASIWFKKSVAEMCSNNGKP